MKYIVLVNVYIKITNTYKTIEKIFDKQKDAIEYISSLGKLKGWESITITAEPN